MTELLLNITLRRYAKPVSMCLFGLVLTFATLVPGGPIESRSFSHLSPAIFWGFNAFLITLGVTAFVIAFSVLRERRAAFCYSEGRREEIGRTRPNSWALEFGVSLAEPDVLTSWEFLKSPINALHLMLVR